ncbi:MAG: carboxypeptidase [Burkholderiales bacterium]|nr:MAG: carboxypeptidase [Burkholderiales bacterium]
MPDIRFNRFYRHAELTALLQAYAQEYPQLASLESIGQSHEGRDIWVLTLTNRATGTAADKPAFWVDGNIHATEVTASVANMYLIHTLLGQYGQDAEITRALDTRAFYVCPRINPDGAEAALADQPKYVRSSMRPYPFDEDTVEGLTPEDIDGDGRILSMRLRDDNGPWKKCAQDPRLMVRRDPTEVGGEYYRVVPEGRVKAYDGVTFGIAKPKQGLDLNRNFPAAWRQEFEQLGAGDFPGSEPEVQALLRFFTSHNNINGAVTFHTWSGVLLRPFDHSPDTDMHAEDLWVYQAMGKKGTELTGYPAISTYHDFRYHPKQVITGGFDWIYEHLGMYCWVVEVWSPQREAGIEKYAYIDWFRDHPVEDDLKLIQWSDKTLGGAGFVDWHPFDHPDLGQVEIGGWNKFHAFSNPPPAFLEKEVARFPRWVLWQALLSPKLELHSTEVKALGQDTWRVRLVVQNSGWLPSYGSKRALERKMVRGLIAEIDLPAGAELVFGKAREELGQLEGRNHLHTSVSFWPDFAPTGDRVKIEWVVSAPAGSALHLTAKQDRAGVVRAELRLM